MEDKKYVNITKVYTKRGDKGQTDLLGGSTARKDSLKVEAYGCIDETSSFSSSYNSSSYMEIC